MDPSRFRPAPWLRGAHLQTIWPALTRSMIPLPWKRERLELTDGDFLDLDWLKCGSSQLVILAHGLEGGSRRHYMCGTAAACHAAQMDVLSWNFRGCSGHPNRLPRAYHSGATEDLAEVVARAEQTGLYEQFFVVGFSLGGNLVLKYLGEMSVSPGRIRGGVAVSVPCDLRASAVRMDRPDRDFYRLRFLRSMRGRMAAKREQFGDLIPTDAENPCRTFRQFDDVFTAPLHGFQNAEDYWARCSANRFLDTIQVPTLVLNAQDDPFLTPECFPTAIAARHPFVYLESPSKGGHVGFVATGNRQTRYWAEQRIVEFIALCGRLGGGSLKGAGDSSPFPPS